MTEEQEQQEVVRIQGAIMQVLREYKARGIEAVEEDVLRAEVERRATQHKVRGLTVGAPKTRQGELAVELRKYGIYRAEFPVQNVSKRENGRVIETTGGEMYGAHRCVVVSADPDGQFAIVCPMTSAQDSRGAEKWRVIKKSWLRIFHQDKPVYITTEQIRYLDATRFNEREGELGEYDREQLDLTLKMLLGC